MYGDRFSFIGSLFDRNAYFFYRVLWFVPTVSDRGDSTAGADFDKIRAGHKNVTNQFPNFLGAVCDRAMQPGSFRYVHACRDPVVSMATGLGNHQDADLQTGPGNQLFVDGRTETRVGTAHFSGAGNSAGQRFFNNLGRTKDVVTGCV